MSELSCAEMRELAPDLALGLLEGEPRAAALAHLEGCRACQDDLDRLTSLVGGLVRLVPPVEPPLGFEDRVAARLSPPEVASRPRWMSAVAAAAAVVIVAAAGVGGWAVGHHGRRTVPTVPPAASAPVMSHGLLLDNADPVGEVFAYRTGSAWLYMAVDDERIQGPVRCQIQVSGGRFQTLGTFTVDDGYAQWDAPMSINPATVTGARLVDPQGQTLAEAVLRPA